nr:hypothetical protein [Tanacetum cinerariifolium]
RVGRAVPLGRPQLGGVQLRNAAAGAGFRHDLRPAPALPARPHCRRQSRPRRHRRVPGRRARQIPAQRVPHALYQQPRRKQLGWHRVRAPGAAGAALRRAHGLAA